MIKIKFAEGCGWRAFYVYVRGIKVFYLGIDPTFEASRAHIFGGIGIERRFGRYVPFKSFRLKLWRSRYWWHLDGRYGTLRRK